ncbi:MAG: polysaccharide ABC transporter ATP-binding protein [Cyanobacteria bacterium J06621_15]
MSDTVIRVENLGKKYIIGHQKQERYTALRDVIVNQVKSLGKLIQNPKSKIQNSTEEFWALKDVSFEIKQGDRVGIIGRNGAGKSTLLKVLSRITEPTTGRISIKGRVASLLEVGTGFHPELTGRENIYLNGAILGMGKSEIKRKFDEIVAFAEVEKFLDTPVKRYSSGMYVRLAFAVAAHLEPEILVVDEVLAVGDAAFQKKCLGKMEDISKGEGRTILFVSHNMDAIQALCKTGILLNQGSLLEQGMIYSMTSSYNNLSLGNNLDCVRNINLSNNLLLKMFHYSLNESELTFTLELKTIIEKCSLISIVLLIYTITGTRIALIDISNKGKNTISLNQEQEIKFEGEVKDLNLVPGEYKLGFSLETSQGWIDRYQLLDLSIQNKIYVDDASFSRFPNEIRGLLDLDYEFKYSITP